MKKNRKIFVTTFVVIVVTFFFLPSSMESDNTATQIQAGENSAKPTPSEKPKETGKASTNPGSTASENVELSKSLTWTFGKKEQTGWFLYVPLIQQTIKTESAINSEDFSTALSKWQKEHALAPTGILNKETFAELTKYWQSRRIPTLYEAEESKLFQAPVGDFFDPSREAKLLFVEKETYTAYKKMIAAAAKDLNLKIENGTLIGGDKYLKIISAYRSRAYQEELRKKEPTAGRAQLALKSPHFTGRALDIYVGGEPVTTKDENRAIQIETKAYKWLVSNAEKFGFYNYFYEPWHWEYVPENNK